MCVSVKTCTSFQDLLHNHFSGWFFAIFRKSSVRVGNDNIHKHFEASQGPTQNLDDFPVSILPRDPPSIENITSVTITYSFTLFVFLCRNLVSTKSLILKMVLLNVEVLYFLTPSNVC